jgi:hypothetical protein
MGNSKFGTKNILPIVTLIIGLLFSSLGFFKYGFWDKNIGTLPGFFPTIIGILLIAVSALAFFQSLKEENNYSRLENWYPVFAVFLIIASTFVFGMYLSLAAFLIIWVRVYEKCSWKTTIITFLLMFVIVFGAFGTWLNIQFPKGLIFNAIF